MKVPDLSQAAVRYRLHTALPQKHRYCQALQALAFTFSIAHVVHFLLSTRQSDQPRTRVSQPLICNDVWHSEVQNYLRVSKGLTFVTSLAAPHPTGPGSAASKTITLQFPVTSTLDHFFLVRADNTLS